MKHLPLYVLGALWGLGLARCQAQPPESPSTMAPATAVAPMTGDEFNARVNTLNDQGQWAVLLQLGRDRLPTHPDEYNAWYAQARGAYMLGDLDLAISSYQKLVDLNPNDADSPKFWLQIALTARRNFPDVHLKPLEFVPGDVSREQDEWTRKGATLLAAKRYDEIETTALALQHSNAGNVQGIPHLDAFFAGLSDDENLPALQKSIAAWRAARPKSNLARLAALSLWTSIAWKARGHRFASSITPEMSARIDAALERGAQAIKTLPKAAFESPLSFHAVLGWGLLAGEPREFFDHFFEAGTAGFPNYLPLYIQRAQLLLPRWGGQPGEWEAMAKKRADQIGGENGDVFYGRVVWAQSRIVSSLPQESHFDYERAQRGLDILQKRHPDSLSVASARFVTAYRSKDWARAKQVLAAPRGYLFADTWWLWDTPADRIFVVEQRMAVLGDAMSKYDLKFTEQ